ncbi:MAG: hypothetical protein HFH14_02035 [Lachnospiraceae bacterium]|nr:hypothetical protein [Lachnospiraceae bacterium]
MGFFRDVDKNKVSGSKSLRSEDTFDSFDDIIASNLFASTDDEITSEDSTESLNADYVKEIESAVSALSYSEHPDDIDGMSDTKDESSQTGMGLSLDEVWDELPDMVSDEDAQYGYEESGASDVTDYLYDADNGGEDNMDIESGESEDSYNNDLGSGADEGSGNADVESYENKGFDNADTKSVDDSDSGNYDTDYDFDAAVSDTDSAGDNGARDDESNNDTKTDESEHNEDKEEFSMRDETEYDDAGTGESMVYETTVVSKGTTIRGGISSDCSLDVMGVITGDVECQGRLCIYGTVSGNTSASEILVETPNKLVGDMISMGNVKISENSVIIGTVQATSAFIAGAVKGDLDIDGPVVVDSSAVICGNITAKSLQLNNGAVLQGICDIGTKETDFNSVFEE